MQQYQTLAPEIRETVQELQSILERQNHLEARDKIAALYLLKLERINNFPDLAKIIGQDLATLEAWFHIYRERGLCGLLRS